MAEEDERIMREFQRLSVTGFDDLSNFAKEHESHGQQHAHGYRYSHGNQLSPFVTVSPSPHKLQYKPPRGSSGAKYGDNDSDGDDDLSYTLPSSSKTTAIASNHSNSGSDDGDDPPQPQQNADVFSKFHRYIYDKSDFDENEDSPFRYRRQNHRHDDRDRELSVDDMINDLKRRKARRLKTTAHSQSSPKLSHAVTDASASRSSSILSYSIFKTSRFMQAANASESHGGDTRQQKALMQQVAECKQTIGRQESEIKTLQQQLSEKNELIKTLQYKLLQEHENTVSNIPTGLQAIYDENDSDDEEKNLHEEPLVFTPRTMRRHMRQKSQTQTQTEQATIENVRWELRSELSRMTSAENEVDRLLQSVGDTSMMHGRLKKIHSTLASHKRKVSAIEQTLNITEFGSAAPIKQFTFDGNLGGASLAKFDEENEEMDDSADLTYMQHLHAMESVEKTDSDTIRNEYGKLKLRIASFEEEAKEWTRTKTELENLNKRCNNLMAMLDKLSDEKLELTLKIEDLQALLHKNNVQYPS